MTEHSPISSSEGLLEASGKAADRPNGIPGTRHRRTLEDARVGERARIRAILEAGGFFQSLTLKLAFDTSVSTDDAVAVLKRDT